MKREIITTLDGSTTIRLPELDECYHSTHGAIQEACHVFINNGLTLFKQPEISIMEIGLGTGLNAFITFLESQKSGIKVNYIGVEGFPVSVEEASLMNYPQQLNAGALSPVFDAMHEQQWEVECELSDNFRFTKYKRKFDDINFEDRFDLIYFDAFGYRVQPELWSEEIFSKMYRSLRQNGILVTYAARSIIKKNMISAGFKVEKLAGPPGKREMMRAWKGEFKLM